MPLNRNTTSPESWTEGGGRHLPHRLERGERRAGPVVPVAVRDPPAAERRNRSRCRRDRRHLLEYVRGFDVPQADDVVLDLDRDPRLDRVHKRSVPVPSWREHELVWRVLVGLTVSCHDLTPSISEMDSLTRANRGDQASRARTARRDDDFFFLLTRCRAVGAGAACRTARRVVVNHVINLPRWHGQTSPSAPHFAVSAVEPGPATALIPLN